MSQPNPNPSEYSDGGPAWIRRGLYGLVLVSFLSFSVLVGGLSGLLVAFYGDLPSLAPLDDYTSSKWDLPTKVYSRNGQLIARFYEERREIVDINELPPRLIQGVIAIEDSRYFEHNGVDFKGILRAAYKNLVAGRIVEGGSTITQQLAKVLFLTPRQTFRRKIKEALLALKIERHYTKREILERYFNKIYFGAGAYGVEAASQVYFGKHARELTPGEATMLSALPKAPSYYSPFNNPRETRERHRIVLERMTDQGMIPPGEARRIHGEFWNQYDRTKHQLAQRKHEAVLHAPYFAEYIRQRLLEQYGSKVVYRGGLKVWTTVDLTYQRKLREHLSSYLLELNKRVGNLPEGASTIPDSPPGDLIEGAVYLKDPKTGQVLSMIGGHHWSVNNQFNRAVQAHRQPGSAFKPILYTAALDHGFTFASRLQDRPVVFQTSQGRWIPRNYTDRYYGEVTLRTALVNSLNVATVDLQDKVGQEVLIRYARKLGVNAPLTPHKSLALGGLHKGVTLADLTNVYSVFANKGIRTDPITLRKVLDREGNLLQRNFPYKREVISPQTAFLITSLLRRVVESGTGRVVGQAFQRPIAGKTGTTNEFRDAWFIGYTPRMVLGTWFGYDRSNQSLGEGMSGGEVAGRFWSRAAPVVLEDHRPRGFPVPHGISYVTIDPTTGYLATPHCPRRSREPFLTGTEPGRRCPVHGPEPWSRR